MLKNTEKGMYGLLTVNGMGEAVTGRDMFGNKLTDDQRKESFIQALTLMGLGGAAHYVDRLHGKDVVHYDRKPKSVSSNNKKIKTINHGYDTQFDHAKLPKGKGFSSEIDQVLKEVGISREEFNRLLPKHHTEMTLDELQKMRQVRDSVPPWDENSVIQKAIDQDKLGKYLAGEETEVGGCNARIEDVSDITSSEDLIQSLRLDYDGTPFSPSKGYAVMRFTTMVKLFRNLKRNTEIGFYLILVRFIGLMMMLKNLQVYMDKHTQRLYNVKVLHSYD